MASQGRIPLMGLTLLVLSLGVLAKVMSKDAGDAEHSYCRGWSVRPSTLEEQSTPPPTPSGRMHDEVFLTPGSHVSSG